MSKYHVNMPQVDDGSNLIYKALASFGDNISQVMKERRERQRQEAKEKRADERYEEGQQREAARDASQGLFRNGAVPNSVVAQDDSIKAALGNMAMGNVAQTAMKAQDFVQPGQTHPHQMQSVGNMMYAPWMKESHQDDDRREMTGFRDAQTDLRREVAGGMTDPGQLNTESAIRNALALRQGELDKQKRETQARDQQMQEDNFRRSQEVAQQTANTQARLERNDNYRMNRDREKDTREARVGTLAYHFSKQRNNPERIQRGLTAEDIRLGIRPGDVVGRIDKDFGSGGAAGKDVPTRAAEIWRKVEPTGPLNSMRAKNKMPFDPAEVVRQYHANERKFVPPAERDAMDREIARLAKEALDAQRRTAPKKKK